MALFELDHGRLVPARFGREIRGAFTPDVLRAVRSQVLEIVSRPLFPITWRNLGSTGGPELYPRLTALDASGQVVAVEVVGDLDAELLIDSLSRLADTAAMSWIDLAREYPGQVDAFKVDWAQFRESMPPTTPNGPRLVIVAASIDPEVRPALDVLASSGVEVHEMTLRQMSNGRAFLDVSAVGPRTYGHRANLLVADANPVLELKERRTAQVTQRPAKAKAKAKTKPKAKSSRARASSVPARLPKRTQKAQPPRERPAPTTPTEPDILDRRNTPVTKATGIAAVPYPSRMERRREVEKATTEAPLEHGPKALLTVSEMIGRPTRLTLGSQFGLDLEAELAPSGLIHTRSGNFADPTRALEALGFGATDGWTAWHLGDAFGPTLAEAVEEINESRG